MRIMKSVHLGFEIYSNEARMTGSPMAGMFAAGRGIRSIGWCEEDLIMTETHLNVSESLQNIIGWGKRRVLLLAVLMCPY